MNRELFILLLKFDLSKRSVYRDTHLVHAIWRNNADLRRP